ncbi:MAG: DUF3570 domain-containing protein [Deltaproteobacteria bacterium]|nr:DUF3570 domain-containing protein [Deltaproteobacteria bacterium]
MSLRALTAALVLVSCGGATARPVGRGELTLHGGVYTDRDQVTVWNPAVRARVPVSRGTLVTGSYGVDLISAASVDVVASASRVVEQRHEGALGARTTLDGRTAVEATARLSVEPDYRSLSGSFAWERETEDRHRTVRLELRGRRDEAGPGWVLQRPETLRAVAGSALVTQVVSARTLVRVGLQAEHLQGWQASVYRFVPVDGAWYPERLPEARTRASATVRVLRSLAPTVSLSGEYGASLDGWGVMVNAVDTSVRWETAPWLVLEGRARVLRQERAVFYQGTYGALTVYRTRDRLLGGYTAFWPMVTARVQLPSWPAERRWELGASASWLHQRFDDFPLLPVRDALTAELWLSRYF